VSLIQVSIVLNDREVETWAPPHRTLVHVLREDFGATEVKQGCGEGVCGTCTVLLDGEPINACLIYAVQADGHHVTTVRGLTGNGDDLHPVHRCFLEQGAAQCGFCTPGMILTAWHYVENCDARPDREDLREAVTGNLCRCTGYTKILDAVERYAEQRFTDAGPARPT
jgi:aerobic carbon-monoxide dehydrogenase small subunit